MTYRLLTLPFSGVQRDADGAYIPSDDANADWRNYQEWLAAGNIPAPAAEPDPNPVPAEIEMWRARAALAIVGKLELADQTAAGVGPVIAEFWKGATSLRRESPTLIAFADRIGLDAQALDDLFRAAARLTI